MLYVLPPLCVVTPLVCARQLLPVFNLFRGKNANMGDSIDYNQRARINIGELVMETLEV